ncbi:hypothetical protein FWG95_02250 [Candidatus Saccharibacteria bacterium]|nr:hypothetical protein [Candidatus Saccharibacteria bacterium]
MSAETGDDTNPMGGGKYSRDWDAALRFLTRPVSKEELDWLAGMALIGDEELCRMVEPYSLEEIDQSIATLRAFAQANQPGDREQRWSETAKIIGSKSLYSVPAQRTGLYSSQRY